MSVWTWSFRRWLAPRGRRGQLPAALAGALLGLQAVFASPVVADTGAQIRAPASEAGSALGQGALRFASDDPPAPGANGAVPGQATPPPASDATPASSAEVSAPPQPAPPPASDAPPPASASGSAPTQVAGQPAAPPRAPSAKPDAGRHNLRLQVRVGAPSDVSAAKRIGDSGLGATYFLMDKAYSLFANLEAVSLFLDKGYDHFESEINLGISPFHARPWLAPLSLTTRVTTDWTEDRTVGFGPSVNLTALPFLERARRAGFNLFFQYYPLKTDDHWGDQDFMFYWSIPVYAPRVIIRGFGRLFINYDGPEQAWIGNDLIIQLIPGVDLYLRDAEFVNAEDVPRRKGFSLGLRSLQRF